MGTSTQALSDAKAAWRTQALLRAMSGDPLLREQFATDPLQVYGDYMALDRRPGCTTEPANQLVFSVLSSPPLRRWLGGYAHRLGGRMPGRSLFARQFAGAIAASRDALPALALMRSAAAGEDVFELQVDFFRSLLAAMGRWGQAGSGTEMSPGATSTEMSPGATGTEMSPGALGLAGRVAAEISHAARYALELRRLMSSQGTEMSPGVTATEMSPGATGTEMSPGALRLAQSLAAAVRRAERFSELLLGSQEGTEMSPGTATEMSPGVTATEMSPGLTRLSEQLVVEVRIATRLVNGLLAAQGTEMSPGGGTEQSPGGTEMSPGQLGLFDTLAAVLRRAELFSLEMLRAGEGTEMSPGTATEMSPGLTATEMSPGLSRFDIADRLGAELLGAARFAAEIFRAHGGTEMSPGVTATEMSPGATGTEMSPGALRLTEGLIRAVRNAQRLGRWLVQAENGTEMSPGTATEMSPGVTATEMSPGQRLPDRLAAELEVLSHFALALQRVASGGTEMSPGVTATEMSPGATGTEMSPGALKLAEALTASLRRARLFAGEILRFAAGTDMSPGTDVGTNMSPGTDVGTNMSPGQDGGVFSTGALGSGLWGVQLPAQLALALGALVRYASVLRQQGALDLTGLEAG